MNKQTIKDNLDVFLKWLDGAEIQCKTIGIDEKWMNTNPAWREGIEYRVKPREPRVWWTNVFKEKRDKFLYDSKQDAESMYMYIPNCGIETIKVMEVITDD